MKNSLEQQEIIRKLDNLRRRLRRRLTGEGVAWLILACVGLIAVTFGFDYTLHLNGLQRGFILGLCIIGVCWIVWRKMLGPLLVRITDENLAVLVEDRFAQFDGRLIGTLQLAGKSPDELAGMSQAMIDKMSAQAQAIASELKFTSVVETRKLRNVSLIALLAAVLLCSLSFAAPGVINLWFQRNILFRDIDWPQRTYLNVYAVDSAGRIQPLMLAPDQAGLEIRPEVEVLRGEDMQIVVTATGQDPHVVTLQADYPSVGQTEEDLSPGPIETWQEKIRKLNSPSRNASVPATGYTKKFQAVSEEFTFYVTGGDDKRGKRYYGSRVKLIDPPSLEKLTFAVQYPSYMRRDQLETLTGDRGVLPLPRGATVQLRALASKSLDQAEILLDDKPAGQIKIVGGSENSGKSAGREIQGSFVIPPNQKAPTSSLKIHLQDTRGYSNRRGEKYVIHILPDQAPEVTLESSGVRHVISPSATIPLLAAAHDDNGVDYIKLLWNAEAKNTATAPATQPTKLIATPITAGPEITSKLTGRRVWDILPLKFATGTKLQIRAESGDFLPAEYGGPNVTASRVLTFEVVPPEKLLGELVAKQKEVRMEFFQAMGQQALAQGRTEAAAEQTSAGKIDAEVTRKLSESAGNQRQVASESAKAADTLAAVALELELNRLGKAEQYQAIRTEIVQPLSLLVKKMRQTAAELDQVREMKSAAQLSAHARQLAKRQEQILREMEEILKHMQKLENRLELARRLEGLLKMSVELDTILRKRVEAGTEDIFDPVEK